MLLTHGSTSYSKLTKNRDGDMMALTRGHVKDHGLQDHGLLGPDQAGLLRIGPHAASLGCGAHKSDRVPVGTFNSVSAVRFVRYEHIYWSAVSRTMSALSMHLPLGPPPLGHRQRSLRRSIRPSCYSAEVAALRHTSGLDSTSRSNVRPSSTDSVSNAVSSLPAPEGMLRSRGTACPAPEGPAACSRTRPSREAWRPRLCRAW